MKKTQVALAALALVASSAALADGVTVSGIIDYGFGHTTNKGTYAENGAWADHSSITFSGAEDLGGGLKAGFNLEAGFNQNGNVDNGGQGNLFSRQSNLYITSAELGTVTVGQILSPFILAQALTNQGVGNFWVNRAIMAGPVGQNLDAVGNSPAAFFIGDAVQYTTPNIAGWQAMALTSAKTGEATSGGLGLPDAEKSNRYTSLAVNGNIAGVNLWAATQNRSTQYSSWTIGAGYQLTPELNLSANYVANKIKDTDEKTNSVAVGLTYKVAPAVSLVAQYAAQTKNDATGEKAKLYNLAAKYDLSKRTATYITYTRGSNGIGSSMADRNAAQEGNNNTIAVGLMHSF